MSKKVGPVSAAGQKNLLTVAGVIDAIEPALLDFGFSRMPRNRDKFSCQLSEDTTGYFFLEAKKRKDLISVEPIFGVRHDRLMQFLAEAGVDVTKRFWPFTEPCWTVSEGFGTSTMDRLMEGGPKFGLKLVGWLFTRPEHIERFGEQICEALGCYVFPWFERHVSVTDTVEELRMGDAHLVSESGCYVTAAGYHILGRDDEAWAVIRAHLDSWIPEQPYHRNEAALGRRGRIWAFARFLANHMRSRGWKPSEDVAANIDRLLSAY